MIASLMVLVVGFLPQFGDAPQASDDDVKAAKRYLKGKWSLVKLVDGGETLGPALIKRKLAQDSLFTIDNLTVHHTDPETLEEKVLAYRVNPAADPKQIDLINANSATFRGIYRFDGDMLTVCVNHENNGLRPTSFESKSGTKDQLFSLSLTDSNPGPDQMPPVRVATAATAEPVRPVVAPTPNPASTIRPQDDLFAAAPKAEIHRVTEVKQTAATPSEVAAMKIEGPTGEVKVLSEIAIPTHDTERKATPSELQTSHDLLTGIWDIVTVTENGERYGTQLIQRKLAQDGKVIIGSRVVQMISPDSGAKRISGYRINPASEPKQIDFTTEFDNVKKGIYKFDGEDLMICLNNDPAGSRPTDFEAPAGSNRRSIRLHMADPEPPTHAEVAPPPAAPSAEELARQKQDTIRNMLVGSWITSDSKGSVTTVLRSDGTFTTTREWSKAVKRLFEGDTSSSSGRWSYENGLLRATILSTSDRKMAGQTFYGRIQSIGATTMVAEDGSGSLKNYKKLR